MAKRRVVTLFTRADCGLCEEALAVLKVLRGEFDFDLVQRDVDADPALRKRYHEHVPVAVLDGAELFRLRADPAVVRGRLDGTP